MVVSGIYCHGDLRRCWAWSYRVVGATLRAPPRRGMLKVVGSFPKKSQRHWRTDESPKPLWAQPDSLWTNGMSHGHWPQWGTAGLQCSDIVPSNRFKLEYQVFCLSLWRTIDYCCSLCSVTILESKPCKGESYLCIFRNTKYKAPFKKEVDIKPTQKAYMNVSYVHGNFIPLSLFEKSGFQSQTCPNAIYLYSVCKSSAYYSPSVVSNCEFFVLDFGVES